jgi:hypothetical protein
VESSGASTAYVNLLLILRGRARRRSGCDLMVREAVGRGCDVMRRAVADANPPAQPFGQRTIFTLAGEGMPYRHGAMRSVSRIMHKRIHRKPGR